MRYRWHTGSFAWIVHRITGVLLTFYILLHLYVLSNLKDPENYRNIMGLMEHPLVKIAEVGLLGLVLAHSLNGVRLLLIDLGLSSRLHKRVFWAVFTTGVLLFIIGGLPIIGGLH
jgi:succinate dehydrogenase / fumarate reductase cytochrome b subunit